MKPIAYEYLLSNCDRHWWHVGKHALIRRLLQDVRETGPVALDIGSSYAFLSNDMGKDARVVSLDRDFNVLHLANIPLAVCAGATALPFASHSFDLVTALDLLEHVPEDALCLKEAARTLKPGGMMVVMVPAYPILWSDLDEIGSHVRRYTPGGLRRLFHRTPGMHIVRFTHFNGFLFLPILFIRLCQRLFKRMSPGLRTESMLTPPRILNDWLTRLFLLEGRIAAAHSLPVGVSLVAVAEKRV